MKAKNHPSNHRKRKFSAVGHDGPLPNRVAGEAVKALAFYRPVEEWFT
jgi:hypothetical protein